MLKMVTDDDTPMQCDGARRILYAMTPDETPDVLLPIKEQAISFEENITTQLRIIKQSL